MNYKIIKKNKETGIKCLRCGRTSWSPPDVENKYCGYCHKFHDFEEELKLLKVKRLK